MNLLEAILWFANPPIHERWLVGVSGGADSVALLRLLVAKGFHELVVCHLDHGLRGRASREDAKFVQQLAEKLDLKCEIGKADVKARMSNHAESLETAARHARHEFFAQCALTYQTHQLLLAHHADDQAETVLWNLLRGSHGLKGMHGEQNLLTESGIKLHITRPLLHIRRAQLIAWLSENKYPWREDASNAEPIAVRNRLRHEALPLLSEISNRDATAALVRGAADTTEFAELETWAIQQVNPLDPQGRLHLPTLQKLPITLQRNILKTYLTNNSVNSIDRRLLDESLTLLDPNGPPSINLTENRKLRRRAGRIFIDE